MPSDHVMDTPPKTRRWLELLRSQGLGVICGQLVVLLLGVGSIVISATREGASARVRMDDIRAFFEPVAAAHFWFYLLLPIFGLYALNTLLCTWTGTVRKWKAGQRSPWQHGPALIHVALLLTMLAHLLGGIFSAEQRPLVLTQQAWRELGDGRQATVLSMRITTHENGQPKQVTVDLAVREGKDGVTTREEVAFNRPLSSGWGARLYLLANFKRQMVARLSDGEKSCAAPARGVCKLGDQELYVAGIYPGDGQGRGAAAKVLRLRANQRPESLILMRGRARAMGSGKTLQLLGIDISPVVTLRVRDAAGNPWALGASLVLLLGMVLMGRRFFQRAG